MAEQSIGFPSGSGDGVAGGYPADRMRLMETNTLGTGVQVVDNNLALTGAGTANLTVGVGAAIVAGYEYENTSSLNINISTLANGTYNVVLIVNATVGTLVVARSATGTTTPAYSVRAAVYTGTPAVPYLLLGTVQVASSAIAAGGITPNYAAFAESRQLPYQVYAQLIGGSATLTTANTSYDVTSYSASSVSNDGILSVNTSTGIVSVRRPGLYVVSMRCAFSTGTTGQRTMLLQLNGSTAQTATVTPLTSSTGAATTWQIITTAATDTINLSASSTIATQSLTSCTFTISRA